MEEKNVAYHAGNYEMNQRSIGIEHEGGPDLPITDAVYNQSIELVTDICRRYGIPADDFHIIPHRQVKATQCPGTLDFQRIINGAKANLSANQAQNLAQEITDQTRIPQIENKEVQQIRSEMLAKDQRIRDLESANNQQAEMIADLRKDYENSQGYLTECQINLERYGNSIPPSPSNPPKTALGKFFYQLSQSFG